MVEVGGMSHQHSDHSVQGLFQNGSVSYKNLYAMVEIVISEPKDDFCLYGWNGNPRDEVPPDDQVVAVGDYVILKPGRASVSFI